MQKEPLELMYITNDIDMALVAESAGVNRVFIDLETIGKEERQKNIDSVKSNHSLQDIKLIKRVLNEAKVQVRINPLYNGSQYEIDTSIENGADIIMLPMFKQVDEVEKFIDMVDSRAQTLLLLETKEAMFNIDEILDIQGVDEIHIGLNDLHLSLNKKFMFQLLAEGIVDTLCQKMMRRNIPYGFGGVGRLGTGKLLAELIITEHYRLDSKMVILSRSFCDINKMKDKNIEAISQLFRKEVALMRDFENSLLLKDSNFFEINHVKVKNEVSKIIAVD